MSALLPVSCAVGDRIDADVRVHDHSRTALDDSEEDVVGLRALEPNVEPETVAVERECRHAVHDVPRRDAGDFALASAIVHSRRLSGSRTLRLKRRSDEGSEEDERCPLDTKERNVRGLPIEAHPRGFDPEERRRDSRHDHHAADRAEDPRRPRPPRGEDQHEPSSGPKRGSSA